MTIIRKPLNCSRPGDIVNEAYALEAHLLIIVSKEHFVDRFGVHESKSWLALKHERDFVFSTGDEER